MRKFLLVLALFAILAVFSSPQAFAYGIFTAGQTGYDISYPQANIISFPTSYDFVVIGTTNGRAYTDNPYLGTQLALASGKELSFYMNLNAPVGSTVKGNTSSPKTCLKTDKICQAYNYGYNAAKHSYDYEYAQSKGITSTMWWLDIETGNSWSSNQAINDATIQGAIDFFDNIKYSLSNVTQATVGIYSNQSMWDSIAGNTFTPTQSTASVVPNWLQSTSCSNTITNNGQTWLIQSTNGNLDHDSAC